VLAISLLKKLIFNYKNMKFNYSLALDVASSVHVLFIQWY